MFNLGELPALPPPDGGPRDGGPSDGAPGQDAAPTDGPPGVTKRIFVTSSFSDGNIGGLAGADARCQTLAVEAGLDGTFLAWLSTSTTTPAARMTHHPGPYALVNGLVIATSWDDLTDGSIAWPISADENGTVPFPNFVCTGSEVWSNTSPAGGLVPGNRCGDWTTTQATASVGNNNKTQGDWSNDSQCSNVSCASRLGFYCVEQ